MYGNRKSLLHTRNKERLDSFNLFLARNRHSLGAIHYSTFYYAESNIYILILSSIFCKPTNHSLAIFALDKFNGIFAKIDR